jgi:hypothetical protein
MLKKGKRRKYSMTSKKGKGSAGDGMGTGNGDDKEEKWTGRGGK